MRANRALSIFGLGYVGCVSAVCFASRGHRVVGVDVDRAKVDTLGRGIAPIVEERIGELVEEVVAAGVLTVTTDSELAVRDTDISLICVGTPSSRGGKLSTEYLERVTEQIGLALRSKQSWHTVVYRSTMLPGTCEGLLIPLLEKFSGKKVGVDFGVCVNPEYLREGTSVSDFFDPPKTVVGQSDECAGREIMDLYEGLAGPRYQVGIGVAEMSKYVDNSFHALKVAFANEIGAICAPLGVDSHDVVDIFVSDTKLNISPAYLRPGFAFGGSCLPKDVRALTYVARSHDVDVPLLNNLLPSNRAHVDRAVDKVVQLGKRKVGVFGLAFKAGTDDLRESPIIELVERLVGKGFDVRIYDPIIVMARLAGANRAFVDERLPHLADLLVEDAHDVVEHAELLVVGSRGQSVLTAFAEVSPEVEVLDLVRLPDEVRQELAGGYHAIAWSVESDR